MDLTGKQINGYTLEKRVNSVGNADVYYATRLNRTNQTEEVAIKVVYGDTSEDPTYIDRFMREMRILEEVQHPHIINVIDWGISEDEQPFLITHWMGGLTSIRALMHKQAFTPEEVWVVVSQVGDVLQHIHARNVLHRDIKPEKVYLQDHSETLHIFLGNFGLSKQIGFDITLTGTGQAIGTVEYMSPEMLRNAKSIDHRTDLYSFAVMIYEMLLGRVPFRGDNFMMVAMMHETEAPPHPISLHPDFPPVLADVVLKGLEKSPDDRWQTAQEFVDAYQNALASLDEESVTTDYWGS